MQNVKIRIESLCNKNNKIQETRVGICIYDVHYSKDYFKTMQIANNAHFVEYKLSNVSLQDDNFSLPLYKLFSSDFPIETYRQKLNFQIIILSNCEKYTKFKGKYAFQT